MKNIGRLALCWLLLVPGAWPAPPPGPDWPQMPAAEFWQRPEVNARIDFTAYNRPLMAAAIFHETNRARRQRQLRAFGHLPRLDEAADLQASMGSFVLEVSHRNPIPSQADVMDRVRSVGLKFRAVGENIALTATLDADPRTMRIVPRRENNRITFHDALTGRELAAMTYAAFAAVVVRQWLDSPGHRANLLSREFTHLGCSARWRKEYTGADLLYSVQVFFTPVAGS